MWHQVKPRMLVLCLLNLSLIHLEWLPPSQVVPGPLCAGSIFESTSALCLELWFSNRGILPPRDTGMIWGHFWSGATGMGWVKAKNAVGHLTAHGTDPKTENHPVALKSGPQHLLLLLLLSRFSRVRLCATPWTAAHQAPLSVGFSRQEHWSG